jgi:uncharacterized protein DUF4253
MPKSRLPQDGDLRLGSLSLSGKQVSAWMEPDKPVAWVTDEPVPGAGAIWRAMSAVTADTGLQPVLLAASNWGIDEAFREPGDLAELDRMDAALILARLWHQRSVEVVDGRPLEQGDALYDPTLAAKYQPFSREFPGLASRTDGQLAPAAASHALASLPHAHVGLVAASQPADVPAVTGWRATGAWESALPVSAVLRSWETRFGARLLQLGPGAVIWLLAERPPRSIRAAQAVAAELWAFCDAMADERGRFSLTTVSEIAAYAPDAPIWGFWWD